MVKYKANPTDLTLLAEYSNMLIRLSQMEESFNKWESKDMNDKEMAYFLEVTNRISQKLLEIA